MTSVLMTLPSLQDLDTKPSQLISQHYFQTTPQTVPLAAVQALLHSSPVH